MKKVLVLALICVLVVGLCSCGKTTNSIVGTWKCTASESPVLFISTYVYDFFTTDASLQGHSDELGDYGEVIDSFIGIQLILDENGHYEYKYANGEKFEYGSYKLYGDDTIVFETHKYHEVEYTYKVKGKTLQLIYVNNDDNSERVKKSTGLPITFKRK